MVLHPGWGATGPAHGPGDEPDDRRSGDRARRSGLEAGDAAVGARNRPSGILRPAASAPPPLAPPGTPVGMLSYQSPHMVVYGSPVRYAGFWRRVGARII